VGQENLENIQDPSPPREEQAAAPLQLIYLWSCICPEKPLQCKFATFKPY